MKTGAFSEKIKAIDFFHMYVKGHVGSKRDVVKTYKGAVMFGNELRHSCEVLRVIPPVPESKQLLTAIENAEKELGNEKIIFHNRSRADVISMLQTYCQQGSPLGNIFNEDVARIEGLTPFQLSVYREACQIPVGETRAYSWFNLRLKRNGLSRAVGGAMRSNPFPLLIPCHRVVRKNGEIGGFMGEDEGASWQLSLKKAILELESLYHQPDLFSKDVSSSVSNVIVLTPKARQVV